MATHLIAITHHSTFSVVVDTHARWRRC